MKARVCRACLCQFPEIPIRITHERTTGARTILRNILDDKSAQEEYRFFVPYSEFANILRTRLIAHGNGLPSLHSLFLQPWVAPEP